MSYITYLLLDADNDPVFDPGAALSDQAAVRQAILTRLKLFLGEWWEDLTIGLPVFQSMLGKLASKSCQAAIQAAIQTCVLGTPYVTGISNLSTDFSDGKFTFTATAQTAFGSVTVDSSLPGNSASLGS
jgi:hypothetical protein